VAEHVFALLLAISHKIPEASDRTRKGDFASTGLMGFDLHGKTLGVIGTGNIGRSVIRIAGGFGMRVLAHDVEPDQELARALDFDYVPLADLLEEADVVTLHVPGTEQTHHLLGSDEIARMKQGAVLINTARGNLVEVEALLHGLADGRLAGAGLDVLPEEPAVREEAELLRAVFRDEHDLSTLLADHVLLRMRDVVITPHSAFRTREAVGRIVETTRDNIAAFESGEPQNVVGG
jgi:D-lactate dehydrogenase